MNKSGIKVMALATAFTLCLGTTAAMNIVSAEETTYDPTRLFLLESGATSDSYTQNGVNYFCAALTDGQSITYKQDLALKWFEEGSVRYFSLDLAFDSLSAYTLDITLETAQNSITKAKKTSNTLTLSAQGAKTNEGDFVAVNLTNGATIAFANSVNAGAGEFDVLVNGVYVGCFENIGGFYAEYVSPNMDNSKVPLTITAHADSLSSQAAASQKIAVRSLNGQSFALNTDGQIVDDTAPVLVVNEQIKSFILGYAVSVDYEVIDVCDATVTKDVVYVQYGQEEAELTSSTYIYETAVYDEYGCEFISITYTLSDDNGNSKTYDLSWYALATGLQTFDGVSYIAVTRNVTGPAYQLEEDLIAEYQEAVDKAAEGVSVGGTNSVYLPSLSELIIDDDTPYERLTFDIYYKTQTSSSASSSTGLTYDKLAISTKTAGKYSFKIIAYDKVGNGVYAMYNGRMVKVTSSNIWDIDSIPEFTFTVYNYGVTIETPGEQEIGYIEKTYSISDFEINAVSGYATDYRLYYFDNDAYYDATGAWASLSALMANPEDFSDYCTEIEEYNSAITEEDEAWDVTDNAYYWYPDSLTFVPQKTGFYFVKVTVTDAELYGSAVTSYQIIEINNGTDIMKGESDWLEENLTSLILFGVAILLAVGIVLVFVIKPVDETLEDLDAKEAAKTEKTKK